MNNLLEHYLEPLKRETFLSNAEITTLFGNIQEIVTFQRQFMQNLEEALELEPDFHKFDHPSHFKNVLFAIGSAFLYYVNHFKLYSSFCASHSKAQKVLHPSKYIIHSVFQFKISIKVKNFMHIILNGTSNTNIQRQQSVYNLNQRVKQTQKPKAKL